MAMTGMVGSMAQNLTQSDWQKPYTLQALTSGLHRGTYPQMGYPFYHYRHHRHYLTKPNPTGLYGGGLGGFPQTQFGPLDPDAYPYPQPLQQAPTMGMGQVSPTMAMPPQMAAAPPTPSVMEPPLLADHQSMGYHLQQPFQAAFGPRAGFGGGMGVALPAIPYNSATRVTILGSGTPGVGVSGGGTMTMMQPGGGTGMISPTLMAQPQIPGATMMGGMPSGGMMAPGMGGTTPLGLPSGASPFGMAGSAAMMSGGGGVGQPYGVSAMAGQPQTAMMMQQPQAPLLQNPVFGLTTGIPGAGTGPTAI